MKYSILSSFVSATLCSPLLAQAPEAVPNTSESFTTEPANITSIEQATATPEKPAAEKTEKEILSEENALYDERVKKELAELNTQLKKIKLEKALLSEELNLAQLKKDKERLEINDQYQLELQTATHEASLAKAKADKLTNELKLTELEWKKETKQFNAEIEAIETKKKRASYANSEPVYLAEPLKDDGTLVISDRRITLNGPITYRTADYITEQINYYNNKEVKQPIFIVIDASPGGSVMAGYRILKSMEGSSSPVYVVVKSFAASMAASICTLAEKSYAYPNAVILHHQINSTVYGNLNLTQQREFYEESQRWWRRLAKPLADKMGITTEEFIQKMYDKNTSGDWMEFAEQAKDLKWVDHIVTRIHETSLLKDPDTKKPARKSGTLFLEESKDEKGASCMFLPRLYPKDCYFIYNKDNYYRLR